MTDQFFKEVVTKIKEECEANEYCSSCKFYNEPYYPCILSTCPASWKENEE